MRTDLLEATDRVKVRMLTKQNRSLQAEVRRLKSELAALRGQQTEETRKQDADDEMVFAIVRGEVRGYEGDRIVIEIRK